MQTSKCVVCACNNDYVARRHCKDTYISNIWKIKMNESEKKFLQIVKWENE